MTNSLRRVSAVASTTFIEMARLRVFYVLVLFALVLVASSSFIARISFQQELQVTKDIALGAVSFFLSLLAIIATAQLLPSDLEDRVVYSVLAKPIPRFEYVIGKFLGVLALLLVTIVVMSFLCCLVIYFRQQSAIRDTLAQSAQSTAEERSNALQAVYSAGVNRDLVATLVAIFAKAVILAALTLCISTFATSTIFTISAMAMIYLIGHLQSIAREYWLQQHSSGWMARSFLALVALIFPDLQAFNLTDQVVAGGTLASGLLPRLIGLGSFYIVVYVLLAISIFYQREL